MPDKDFSYLVPSTEGILPNDGVYVQNLSPKGAIHITRVWLAYRIKNDHQPEVVLLDEERSVELGPERRVMLDSAERLQRLLLDAGVDQALKGLTSDDYEVVYTAYFEPDADPKPAGTREGWARMVLGVSGLLDIEPGATPTVRVPRSSEGWN